MHLGTPNGNRRAPNLSTSHNHSLPTDPHKCYPIHLPPHIFHMHRLHSMATHHKKRMPRPHPPTSAAQPHNYLQHKSQLTLHHPHSGPPPLLILRPTKLPNPPHHTSNPQHPQTMVHALRRSSPTPATRRPTNHRTEHATTNRWMELRTAHAPHKPCHYLPKRNTSPTPHTSSRTPTLTNIPPVRPNRRTRPQHQTNHKRTP